MIFNKNKNINKTVTSLKEEVVYLKEGLLNSLLSIAWMVEAKDPYTGGHLWRVSQFARIVGEAAGATPTDINKLAIAGFLHDIGKIGIPDEILCKPGRLTEDEFSTVKLHPQVGKDLLDGHPLANLAEDVIYSHHEMPNGKGYPRGLKANSIPDFAKIVGLCDAFDAMTSTRPYRKGMPLEKAILIIEENLGEQFDQHYGNIFIQLAKEGGLNHIIAHSDNGIPLQECSKCGPTVVIRREQVIGDHTFCPVCKAEFLIVKKDDETLGTKMTGASVLGQDVNHKPNYSYISDLVSKLLNKP